MNTDKHRSSSNRAGERKQRHPCSCRRGDFIRGEFFRGVTLIEILVVITIIAVAGALVMPSIGAGLDNLRLRTTAERLASTFLYARERAIRRQTICQVRVDPQNMIVELDELTAEGAQGAHRSWELPAGVEVKEDHARAFVFSPDGAAPRLDLTLANSRGRTARIQFDPLTALPLVEVGQAESK
jgi:prepilin-type N-terminal cleavage/methylation domain-containing protein